MSKKNWCTKFPEHWYAWVSLFKWKKVYIGDCCENHDDNCNTHSFLKCLRKKRVVGVVAITTAGMLGCLIKYFKV